MGADLPLIQRPLAASLYVTLIAAGEKAGIYQYSLTEKSARC
jgi:hypothetical protein